MIADNDRIRSGFDTLARPFHSQHALDDQRNAARHFLHFLQVRHALVDHRRRSFAQQYQTGRVDIGR